MTAVSQFWSLAADIYTPEQGKRLARDVVLISLWTAAVLAIGREHARRAGQGVELVSTEPVPS
jgi:hypothetical protein